MRRLVALLISVVSVIAWGEACFALDWQRLHNRADTINLTDAEAKALQISDPIDNLYVLGLVYLNLHKDTQALDTFKKILSLDNSVIEAKWGEAEVLRRQHKLDESEKLLSEAMKSKPDFSPAYITLGFIKYTRMDFNAGARLANKVLAQGERNVDTSNHVRAHLLLGANKGMIAHYGGVLSKIINGTAVLSTLKAAEEIQPDSAAVKFGMGSFYLLAPGYAGGDIQKAKRYLRKAVEIDPLFPDAYVRLAQVYKALGDNANYQANIERALQIDPQNELALDIKSGTCKFICIKNFARIPSERFPIGRSHF